MFMFWDLRNVPASFFEGILYTSNRGQTSLPFASWLFHIISKNHGKRKTYCRLFPTSLCGVLVFDSVSRAPPPPPSPPPPSSTLCHHTLCPHTLYQQTLCPHTLSNTHFINKHFVHTHFVTTHFVHTHTLSTNTLSPHLSTNTLSTHTLSPHTLSTHTLSTNTLSPHTLSTHALSTYTLSPHNTICHHTLCPHTLCQHTLCHHTLCPHTLYQQTLCQHIHFVTTHFVHTHVVNTHFVTTHFVHTHFINKHFVNTYGVAQTHIYCRFVWQAWDRWHLVARLDGLGRQWRRGTLCGRRGTNSHLLSFHVPGVAQTHIYSRLACQAWDRWPLVGRLDGLGRLWRRGTLCGRRGTTWHPPWFHVAGVAQTYIYGRFAWQTWDRWHLVARLDGLGRPWRRGTLCGKRGTTWHPPSFHVAGVAQTHIYCRFAWQVWDRWYFVARLDGLGRPWRRGTLRGRRGTNSHLLSFHVPGVAQTHIYCRFAWQAWDRCPWRRGTLCGRRGTNSHLLSFHVAGVAQTHIYCRFAWQAWDRWHWVARLDGLGRLWTGLGLGACDAAALCVAGVAQPDIHLRFTWQAWHKLTSTVVLRGRRGTDGTGWRAWTGLGACDAAALCVAGVAQPDIHLRFTWQVWHKLTSTVVLRARRGTDGTGGRAWTGLGARDAAALCVAGVAQTHIYCRFAW